MACRMEKGEHHANNQTCCVQDKQSCLRRTTFMWAFFLDTESVFYLLEPGRDPQYRELNTAFTVNVVDTSRFISNFPRFMRSWVPDILSFVQLMIQMGCTIPLESSKGGKQGRQTSDPSNWSKIEARCKVWQRLGGKTRTLFLLRLSSILSVFTRMISSRGNWTKPHQRTKMYISRCLVSWWPTLQQTITLQSWVSTAFSFLCDRQRLSISDVYACFLLSRRISRIPQTSPWRDRICRQWRWLE